MPNHIYIYIKTYTDLDISYMESSQLDGSKASRGSKAQHNFLSPCNHAYLNQYTHLDKPTYAIKLGTNFNVQELNDIIKKMRSWDVD